MLVPYSSNSLPSVNFDLPQIFKSAKSASALKRDIYSKAEHPVNGSAFIEAFQRYASAHASLFNNSVLFKEIQKEIRHIVAIQRTAMIEGSAGKSVIGKKALLRCTKKIESLIIRKKFDQLIERFKSQGMDFAAKNDFQLLLDYVKAGLVDVPDIVDFIARFSGDVSLDGILGALRDKPKTNREILSGLEAKGIVLYPIEKYGKDVAFQNVFDWLSKRDLHSLIEASGDDCSIDEAVKIHFLNNRGWHLRDLGLSNEALLQFFEKFGDRIHVFNACGIFDPKLSLELMEHCPNLNVVLLNHCNIDESLALDFAKTMKKMEHIQKLDVCGNNFGLDGARAIGELVSLLTLDISINGLGPGGIQALVGLVKLKHLNISFNALGPGSIQGISVFEQLESLDISYNELGPGDAKALDSLKNLRELNIFGNRLGPDDAQAISVLKNLRELNIDFNRLGPTGIKPLFVLGNLRKLSISNNRIGNTGIVGIEVLKKLRKLNIAGNEIDSAGTQPLSALINLRKLKISFNRLGPTSVQPLRALVNLRKLDIAYNAIGNAGAAEIEVLNELQKLDVTKNDLTGDGARSFYSLKKLQYLDVKDNNLRKSDEELLKTNLPNTKIRYRYGGNVVRE